jgi:hypothetical protein
MLEFKSPEDLSKLSPDDPAFPIVEDLVKQLITDYVAEGYVYRPEDDGYTILVEPEDADRELNELWPGYLIDPKAHYPNIDPQWNHPTAPPTNPCSTNPERHS